MNDILKEIIDNQKLLNDNNVYNIDLKNIDAFINDIKYLFFPNYYDVEVSEEGLFNRARNYLFQELDKVVENSEEVIKEYFNELPLIQIQLYKDIEAIYNHDPAAKNYSEIILVYPGFLATLHYRLAHKLYELNVPVIPRIICELSRIQTSIDIHPGAQIGEAFCIDHGMGIVIGETTEVGNNVRLYHGVTLGVRKFIEDEKGNLLKGWKRHPNIGNNVTIYANASILGGDTYISDNSEISSHSLITYSPKEDN